MPRKYHGNADDLERQLKEVFPGIEICRNKQQISLQARTARGCTINFYERTRTLQFQNENQADIQAIESLLETDNLAIFSNENTNIFIVYGHDLDAKDNLELILHRWGLQPVALQNMSGGGDSILDNLETNIKKCSFGIVLLTPDDRGFAIKDGEGSTLPRARQNVILEMGMLIAYMGRKKVAVIRKSDTELPSDVHGIIYLSYERRVEELKDKLRQRLREHNIHLKD